MTQGCAKWSSLHHLASWLAVPSFSVINEVQGNDGLKVEDLAPVGMMMIAYFSSDFNSSNPDATKNPSRAGAW